MTKSALAVLVLLLRKAALLLAPPPGVLGDSSMACAGPGTGRAPATPTPAALAVHHHNNHRRLLFHGVCVRAPRILRRFGILFDGTIDHQGSFVAAPGPTDILLCDPGILGVFYFYDYIF